jgi:hypothetical protein
MTQAMTVDRLGQRRCLRRVLHRLLQAVCMDMMATDSTASRIDGKSRAGEDILPSLFRGRLRILACQCVRHIHDTVSLGQISPVQALNRSKMLL